MKRFGALLLSLAAAASLTACELSPSEMLGSDSQSTTEATTAESTEATTMVELPDRYSGRQTIRTGIGSDERRELTKASFSGECKEKLSDHADISGSSDFYLRNFSGIIGIPIEISFDSFVHEPEVVITYDRDELHGIPEENLVLVLDEDSKDQYRVIKDAKVDKENCTLSFTPSKEGVYIVVDIYQFLLLFGETEAAEYYAYDSDVTQYETDWEHIFDTGSIMELADKQWAVDNAPDFHVSTPEELASAVYYVNGLNYAQSYVSITLEDDIDLTGYDWRAMGWIGTKWHVFSGVVDGQGHTINGMTMDTREDGFCGLIGYGIDVTMKDISFTNADVTGLAGTAIAAGVAYESAVWTNVHVQGKVYSDQVNRGTLVGAGDEITFVDCSADVLVNGKPFPYLSYSQMAEAEGITD